MNKAFIEAPECPVGILIDLSEEPKPLGPTVNNLMDATMSNSQAEQTGDHRRDKWTGGAVAVNKIEPGRCGQRNDDKDNQIKMLQEQIRNLNDELREKKKQLRRKQEALETSQEEVTALNKKLRRKAIIVPKPKVEQVLPPDTSLEDTVLVSTNDGPEAELLEQSQPSVQDFVETPRTAAKTGSKLFKENQSLRMRVQCLERNLKAEMGSKERQYAILGQVAQVLENVLKEPVNKDEVLKKLKVLAVKYETNQEIVSTVEMALQLKKSTAMTLSKKK